MNDAILYDVRTLYDCMQDPATVAWMVQMNVPVPEAAPPGRYPSPAEVRDVIDAIPGISSEYVITKSVWEVSIVSRKDVSWAMLAIKGYAGLTDEAQPFYFTGGWDEVILLVTTHLAKRCGSFVLLHNSGASPQIVM